jgi:glycosyltransferase involved in cell wall biosynthesis
MDSIKPTIIWVTPAHGREFGGVGVSSARITDGLKSIFNVIVVTPGEFVPTDSYMERKDEPNCFEFNWRDHREHKQFLNDLVMELASCHKAIGVCAFYAGDLAFSTIYAAKQLDLKSAIFCRGNDIDLDIFSASAFHVQWALSNANKIFTVTSEMAKKVETLTRHRNVQFIANSVNAGLFSPTPVNVNSNAQRIKVGMFGEIKDKKGLPLLIESLDFQHFELHIFGRLRVESEKYLHGLGLLAPDKRAQIYVHPYSTESTTIKSYYMSVDIVCIPSHHDGMPNVLLEAMSMGRLCICSAVGGALDVIDPDCNGLLFHPRDSEDLQAKLAVAAAHVQNHKQITELTPMGTRAREKIIESYSNDHERTQYHVMLRDLFMPPLNSQTAMTRKNGGSAILSTPLEKE